MVRTCQLVEVLAAAANDQGPPKYCVVAPERTAFERPAVGAKDRLATARPGREFEFADGAIAAQQLVGATRTAGAPARRFRVARANVSLTQDDHADDFSPRRHPQPAARTCRAQSRGVVWALTAPCVRSFCAGKAQFEITIASRWRWSWTPRSASAVTATVSPWSRDRVGAEPQLANPSIRRATAATMASTHGAGVREGRASSPPLNAQVDLAHYVCWGFDCTAGRRVLDDGQRPAGPSSVLKPGPWAGSRKCAGHLLRRELGGVAARDATRLHVLMPPRSLATRRRGATSTGRSSSRCRGISTSRTPTEDLRRIFEAPSRRRSRARLPRRRGCRADALVPSAPRVKSIFV